LWSVSGVRSCGLGGARRRGKWTPRRASALSVAIPLLVMKAAAEAGGVGMQWPADDRGELSRRFAHAPPWRASFRKGRRVHIGALRFEKARHVEFQILATGGAAAPWRWGAREVFDTEGLHKKILEEVAPAFELPGAARAAR